VAGDAHAHQNPGLLALSLVWFRYHNVLAARMQEQHSTWSDEKLFHAARRRVIAILQVRIIVTVVVVQ